MKRNKLYVAAAALFAALLLGTVAFGLNYWAQNRRTKEIQGRLQEVRAAGGEGEETADGQSLAAFGAGESLSSGDAAEGMAAADSTVEAEGSVPVMLPGYRSLYEMNSDIIGWLSVEGTKIDYPVMQTMEDECYYLTLDFYGEPNKNGCLIMDTDSTVGVGTADTDYAGGEPPSTNLIIHGHTMKSGEMFGDLPDYADKTYGLEHSVIRFDSLYEEREYELIAAFYSQVYYENEDVFKYYKFFQAETQEEFDDWYHNIKELSLYDTGVTAELGDEFITLSCCAYHVEDGRFVVVGRRKAE